MTDSLLVKTKVTIFIRAVAKPIVHIFLYYTRFQDKDEKDRFPAFDTAYKSVNSKLKDEAEFYFEDSPMGW